MMSEYNRYILADIWAMFQIGSILVQYFPNMAVLLGTWLLELNVSKCKMVSYSMTDRTDTTYSISDDGETYALEKKIK